MSAYVAFKPSFGASIGDNANSLRLTQLRRYFAFSILTYRYCKSTILWDKMPCSVVYKFTGLLKKYTASIFRVEE
jgi:hypothetical protein